MIHTIIGTIESETDILPAEIREATRKVPVNKALGCDGVLNELMKCAKDI